MPSHFSKESRDNFFDYAQCNVWTRTSYFPSILENLPPSPYNFIFHLVFLLHCHGGFFFWGSTFDTYIYIYIFFFSLAFCVIVFRLHFFSHARSNLFLLSSSLIFGQVFLLVNGSTDVNLFLCHGIYLFKFKKHTHEKGGEVLIQIYIVHHKHHSNFLKFDSVYILNNSRNTIFFL